jgi:hypothetical protein
MQKDFHYYCVAVLARAAGFTKKDALTIGYASQYVDDATEAEGIKLGTKKNYLKFDPVRTAYDLHKINQGLKSLDWSSQKRIFIPFHFLPAQPFNPEKAKAFSFITKPDSAFARNLMTRAARTKDHKYRLCAIGIAVHTYADTWSHQGFSGRRAVPENDVESIHLYERSSRHWKHLRLENLALDVLPQIGHAEAGFFPDLPFQKWKCTTKWKTRTGPIQKNLQRDNTEVFLEAGHEIYNRLHKMSKEKSSKPIPWKDLEPEIRDLLTKEPKATPFRGILKSAARLLAATKVEERCSNWQTKFASLFRPYPPGFPYHYDPKQWRKAAIHGDTEWDEWSEGKWAKDLPRKVKPGFWDSLWVHFHRAALSQRHFVLENLP